MAVSDITRNARPHFADVWVNKIVEVGDFQLGELLILHFPCRKRNAPDRIAPNNVLP